MQMHDFGILTKMKVRFDYDADGDRDAITRFESLLLRFLIVRGMTLRCPEWQEVVYGRRRSPTPTDPASTLAHRGRLCPLGAIRDAIQWRSDPAIQ